MFMRKTYYYIFAFIVALISSCNSDEYVGEPSTLSFSVVDEEALHTRSLPALSEDIVAKFNINLTRKDISKDVFIGTIERFKSLQPISVANGTYSVTARYGDNPNLSLDAPYFFSDEVVFEMRTGETKNITIPCKVGNSLAGFTFKNKAQLDKVLLNYRVEAKVGNDVVSVLPESAQHIYFKQGVKVDFYLKGTWAENGQEYSKLFAVINSAQASKIYKYGITIDPSNITGAVLDIKIDETVDKAEITEILPQTWLPKPKISATGFDETNVLYVTETDEVTDAQVLYSASSPLQDAIITFDLKDNALSRLNKSYQLSTITDEDKQQLAEVGVNMPELDTKHGAINLKQLCESFMSLDDAVVDNKIKVKVKANERWSNETEFSIKVDKPEFSMSIPYGNLWTREFTAVALQEKDVRKGKYTTISANVRYYYSTDKNNWLDMPTDYKLSALQAGTTIYLKPVYRQTISGKVTEVRTYEEMTVPNSDLNEGYTSTNPKSGNPLYKFKGGWIDTRNSLTCHSNGINAFYVSKSSTLPLIDSGNNVAHMMTIGWGSGNTCAFGKKAGSVIYNISAGMLCMGDYNAETDEVTGKEMYARPTSMTFNYKAMPFKDDEYIATVVVENITDGEITVLGRGEYKSNAQVDTYTDQKVDITYNYTDENQHLKVTNVKVIFKSGTKEDRDHLKDTFEDANKGWWYSYAYIKGSELWVNSFRLNYEK